MKKLLSFLLILLFGQSRGQDILSPELFFQTEIGSKFSTHYETLSYVDYLVSKRPDILWKQNYGTTPEGRPLFLVIRSNKENTQNLENIRKKHLQSIFTDKSEPSPLINWLSFNIHGDEAAGTETALQLLFRLATTDFALDQVIIIDPCLNPDGRERYVQWFAANYHPNITFDPQDIMYHQSWPDGRYNHYLSDLNRDWLWQVQPESRQRLKIFNDWMPHTHVDFHEMEPNKSYFFPPSSAPIHSVFQDWQSEAITHISEGMKQLFEAKNWPYYNKKEFDLFYPSYGDSYATFNGSLGLTFEQGGSDEAALFFIQGNDTLTLAKRIEKHLEAAICFLKSTNELKDKLTQYQENHFKKLRTEGVGLYKNYIVRAANFERRISFEKFLQKTNIEYQYALTNNKGIQVKNLIQTNFETLDLQKHDIIIPANQNAGNWVKVLFEEEKLADTVKTYDVSAWNPAILHHLELYGTKELVSTEPSTAKQASQLKPEMLKEGFSWDWNASASATFLSYVLRQNLPVYFTENPLGECLMIPQGSIQLQIINDLIFEAQQSGVELKPIGKELLKRFKINEAQPFKIPRIALLTGTATKESATGDFWYYFEKNLQIPFSLIRAEALNYTDIDQYDILIFPDGNYRFYALNEDKIKRWVAMGGRLLLLENALRLANRMDFGQLNLKNLDEINYSGNKNAPENLVQGALVKVKMHPRSVLSKGLSEEAYFYINEIPQYTLSESKSSYICGIDQESILEGTVGQTASNFLDNSFVFGTYYFGKGAMIQLDLNPLYRNIVEDGKLLIANALFMPLTR